MRTFAILVYFLALQGLSFVLEGSVQSIPGFSKAHYTSIITKSVDPFLYTKQINIPGYPEAFNASIIEYGDRFLLIFRIGKETKCSIGAVLLDQNFEAISSPQIFTHYRDGTSIPTTMQDARVFACDGQLYLTYNGSEDPLYKTGSSRRDMFLSKLSYEEDQFVLAPHSLLMNPERHGSQLWEKNWFPFEWQGQMLFGYSINPLEVISVNQDTGYCPPFSQTSAPLAWDYGLISGGTPALIVEGEYLAFFHSFVIPTPWNRNARTYFIGAYTFSKEPPFQITKMTKEPLIAKSFYTTPIDTRRSIFPCGYVVVGDNIQIVYGRNNKEIWVATISKDKLFSLLEKVNQ